MADSVPGFEGANPKGSFSDQTVIRSQQNVRTRRLGRSQVERVVKAIAGAIQLAGSPSDDFIHADPFGSKRKKCFSQFRFTTTRVMSSNCSAP